MLNINIYVFSAFFTFFSIPFAIFMSPERSISPYFCFFPKRPPPFLRLLLIHLCFLLFLSERSSVAPLRALLLLLLLLLLLSLLLSVSVTMVLVILIFCLLLFLHLFSFSLLPLRPLTFLCVCVRVRASTCVRARVLDVSHLRPQVFG